MMPLRVALAGLLVLASILITTPGLGAATRHMVAAAQPPAVCAPAVQP